MKKHGKVLLVLGALLLATLIFTQPKKPTSNWRVFNWGDSGVQTYSFEGCLVTIHADDSVTLQVDGEGLNGKLISQDDTPGYDIFKMKCQNKVKDLPQEIQSVLLVHYNL